LRADSTFLRIFMLLLVGCLSLLFLTFMMVSYVSRTLSNAFLLTFGVIIFIFYEPISVPFILCLERLLNITSKFLPFS
jgi:hypothetical protein